MPPLPGVLAMLSPSQHKPQSYNSQRIDPKITTGSSCIAEISKAYTELAINNNKNIYDIKFENNLTTALNAITSTILPSNNCNNRISTAKMVPSKNNAAKSSDSKNNNPPIQTSTSGGGGGSDCGSTSDSGSSTSSSSSSSSSSSGSESGSTTSSNSTNSNQSKSLISKNSKDSLNNNSNNAKGSSTSKDSSKSKPYESSSSNTTKDNCDNKDNENGSVELSTEVDSDTTSSTSMFGRPRKIFLKNVNAHITCSLCNGYLIDATTIVECLHSFCHSCIMNYLRKDQYCPRCEMMINTTKHNNIKLDTTLQAIVYKLVPGLYEKELLRKRAFYSTRPDEAKLATPEQRGDDTEHLIFGPTDNMSLSLEYADVEEIPDDDIFELRKPKYLQCPANFTVAHLKKFVFGKFGIDQSRFIIDIMYKVKTIVLADHYKMMDVAYIYTWKRDAPMKFFFRVKELENRPRRKKCNRLPISARPKPVIDEKAVEIKTKDEEKKEKKEEEMPTEDKIVVETQENNEIKVEIKEETELTPESSALKIETHEDLYEVPQDCMVVVPVDPALIIDPGIVPPEEDIQANCGEELMPRKSLQCETMLNEITAPVPVNQTVSLPKESPDRTPSDPRTEKLKITLVNKGKSSPKHEDTPKSKSSSKNKTPKHSPPEPDDRKVENIKLKIGLSKQGSVTIINMSVPEANKKENVKPAKPEKEWKIKVRKDKDKDKDKSNGSHDKGKSTSPHEKTVPPITIEIGKSSSPNSNKNEEVKVHSDDEVKKSEFLNSIDLTPIKSINSPEKIDRQKTSGVTKSLALPTTSFTIKKPSMPPPPAPPAVKSSAASKRKSKEPVKAIPKKPKLDLPPLKPVQPQIKVRTNLIDPSHEKPAISFKLSPFPIGSVGDAKNGDSEKSPSPPAPSSPSPQKDREAERKLEDEKLMPAPPPLKMLDLFKRNGVKGNSKSKGSNAKQAKLASNDGFLRPIVTTSMSQNSKVPIVSNVMGNRTPIARRYPPILPKSQTKNPFASLAGDAGSFLQGNSTEIKPIQNGENKEIKIYGPPAVTSANSNQKPPVSIATSMAPMQSPTQPRSTSKSSSTNYLNAALMNSAKSKMSEIPLGCRTPIYTPSSPIYSPNSPQYMPNYNIPIQPTYKYTKTQSSATNYLQTILGTNKQLSNLFPAPPVQQVQELGAGANKPDMSNQGTSKVNNTSPSHGKMSPEPSSDKQTPVQSLLNSCNINIPSSLSITIRNENDDANSGKLSKMKHSSPVNNYIEILKLPDTTTITSESPKPTMVSPSEVKPSTQPRSPTNVKLQDNTPNSKLTSPSKTKTPTNTKSDAKVQNSASKSKSPAVTESDKKGSPNTTAQKSSKKTPSPDKKSSEKRKAEKRSASELTKSPKDKFDISPAALKKYRPILPRSKTPPITGPGPLPSMPSLNTNVMPKLSTGNTKLSLGKAKKSPKTTNQSIKAQNAAAAASAKKALAEAAAQRKSVTPPAVMPNPLMPSPPMPPTGGLSAELTAFLTQQRQLLQQQQQQQQQQHSPPQNPFNPLMAAAAAGNPSFLPHLGAFHPAAANINMQRAYIMEHLARMQKAGAEAMEKFMQLKNNNVSCVKSPSGSPGNEGSPNNSMSKNVKNSV